ncbi:hypothetical protein PFICI_09269 [Pestalotiopsis fici W106-1]|uniref:Uncharacterized protein n=1 Tax=Pestalotiopsis fici (strain W106-1 / CGMCC3.15140) TaxID=1229662 RepID=W3X2N2_PESFW|nr:uncharacterized protein PFICI_09269 [Pestalotiopsis fici W106-1]ETS79416.1 hypothetical protein PFICI_09269 [Pestalotiopsis fici W106-1]
MSGTANCTSAPAVAATDAGVAGTGVLLSFIFTAVIAIVISASLIIQEQYYKQSKPSVVRRKLLNAYSDQQILTGIGIQSVGLVKMHIMIPYHFFIIWMLSLLAMAVHNATLLALVHDFRRDWVLRWLRQFLMFVSLALSSVYGGIILKAVENGLTESTLPIACVWDSDAVKTSSSGASKSLSYFGTIAVIAINAIIFGMATWYLHSRDQKFYRITQIMGLVLMTASAVGATVRVITLSQAFGSPSVPLADEGEKSWSFGTLLSLTLLILPLISVIEILRGEVRCAPPVPDEGDRTKLLGTDENELHPFQPNPFWGGQNQMRKR